MIVRTSTGRSMRLVVQPQTTISDLYRTAQAAEGQSDFQLLWRNQVLPRSSQRNMRDLRLFSDKTFTILLKLPYYRDVELQVCKSDTAADVYKKLRDRNMVGDLDSQFVNFVAGRIHLPLTSSKTMGELMVQSGDVFQCSIQSAVAGDQDRAVQVLVELPSGKAVCVDVRNSSTTSALYKKLRSITEVGSMNLSLRGRVLPPSDETLVACGLGAGGVLQLGLKIKGGMRRASDQASGVPPGVNNGYLIVDGR